MLGAALEEGGWSDEAHAAQLAKAAATEDPQEPVQLIHALVSEETRLGMLVGVSVGFELARELAALRASPDNDEGNHR